MNQSRPKNLNLFTISFPLPAIISILHRISGFILFLCIPFALWSLQRSLTDSGFQQLHQWSHLLYVKLLIWLCIIPLCFHLVAGIRHLLSDVHLGDTLKAGKWTSVLTLIVTALLVLLTGIWLW